MVRDIPDSQAREITTTRKSLLPIMIVLQAIYVGAITLVNRVVVTSESSSSEAIRFPAFMVVSALATVSTTVILHETSTPIPRDRTSRSRRTLRLQLAPERAKDFVQFGPPLAILTVFAVIPISDIGNPLILSLIFFAQIPLVAVYQHSLGTLLYRGRSIQYVLMPVALTTLQSTAIFVALLLFGVQLRIALALFVVAPFVLGLIIQRSLNHEARVPDTTTVISGSILMGSLSSVLVWVFVQTDQVLIPSMMRDDLALDYVQYTSVSRTPLLLAATLAPILHTARNRSSPRKLLGRATPIIFTTFGLILLALAIGLAGPIWFSILFQNAQSRTRSIVDFLPVGSHLLSAIIVLVAYSVMREVRTTVIMLAATILAFVSLRLVFLRYPNGITLGHGMITLCAIQGMVILSLLPRYISDGARRGEI